ncbi:MAG TPA: amidohydrolase [Rhodothermales bacterium]|nr:amidohydrolase [Bacteroidota bacterium]HRK73826.1 amidohydrolase [Rhodothermales bacterium]HRR08689.1 amidohydrolase [Rhodothermales bacterium]
MQDILYISAIQTDLHWESPENNRAMLDDHLLGIDSDTDVIVLPEMFTTGFSMNPRPYAEPPDGPTLAWMKAKAQAHQAALTGSFMVCDKNHFYNRLFWVFPDGRYKSYDKRHLFRMVGEEQVYSSGNKQLIIEWKGWKICPLICYDLRFPVWSRNIGLGYDLLIYVANWPAARASAWRALLPARAIENLSYVVGINRVGIDGNGKMYQGDSLIADYKGQILWEGDKAASSITYPLSHTALLEYRNKFPAHLDADQFSFVM